MWHNYNVNFLLSHTWRPFGRLFFASGNTYVALNILHDNRQEGNIRFNAALRREQDKPYIPFLADQQYRCHFFNVFNINKIRNKGDP